MLDLSGVDADTTRPGNQSLALAGGPAAHSVWISNPGTGLKVRADVDGDAKMDMEIHVTNMNWFNDGDFLL